jgi:hypothetical protein
MIRTKHLSVAAAVVAAFIASSLWYSPVIFGKQFIELSGMSSAAGPAGTKIALELLRNVVLALVILRLTSLLRFADWKNAMKLSALLWIGFPAILLSGSVMWQGVPAALALIHAGDWLMKIFLMMAILGFASFRRRAHAHEEPA